MKISFWNLWINWEELTSILAVLNLLFFFNNFYLFTYLFLALLGLRCCRDFSLVVASGGYSLAALPKLLIVVASVNSLHRL